MTEVVGVRFKDTGKTYYFDPGKLDIHKNDVVIVETARGTENGTAVYGNKAVRDEEIVTPLKPVQRIATKEDLARIEKTESLKRKHILFVKRRLRNINSI